jgi:hypothetical protein
MSIEKFKIQFYDPQTNSSLWTIMFIEYYTDLYPPCQHQISYMHNCFVIRIIPCLTSLLFVIRLSAYPFLTFASMAMRTLSLP